MLCSKCCSAREKWPWKSNGMPTCVVSREEVERLSRALGGRQGLLRDLGRGREVTLARNRPSAIPASTRGSSGDSPIWDASSRARA